MRIAWSVLVHRVQDGLRLQNTAAAYLMQYALMQLLSSCADSSDAYTSKKFKLQMLPWTTGLLAVLQVMADCMSSAAAFV